jgi:TatD DNase family protein
LYNILKKYEGLTGTIHFFVGSSEQAQKFIDLGFYISFSGVITFAKEYEGVVRAVPLDRILVETDCPYATPAPHRGKRNEPTYVAEIARKVADLKGLSIEEVSLVTLENTKKLFGLNISR